MIYKGVIKYADKSKNEYRVLLPNFFDETYGIKDEHYPKAQIGFSYPVNSRIGVFLNEFLKVGTWVWCMLENNEPNKPVIIGYVYEKIDIPDNIMDSDTPTMVEINNKYGITKKYENDNINVKYDGDIEISLKEDGYKSLLTQLNDLKTIIVSLIHKYNNHVHDTVNAQGIKGKALKFGVDSNIQDSSPINPHSIPDLTVAISSATANVPTNIDPVSGLHLSILTARLSETTVKISSAMSINAGESENDEGEWNKTFSPKQSK